MEYKVGAKYIVVSSNANSFSICVGDVFTVKSIDTDGDVHVVEDIDAFFTKKELEQRSVVLLEVIEVIDNRFKSGNSVPVQQAKITKEEWENIKGLLYGKN